jgi:myo-inositol 2-dehydrogenase/D-chiro-inositol 1-dehydrogenase
MHHRFAEASKNQEELSLVGTHGKLEAFAPSHGVRTLDASTVNYRRGIRSQQIVNAWKNVDPPSPEECGELHEMHIGVDEALLEAGNHCGATYEEVRAFTAAVLGRLPPTVSLSDGSKAVMMGLAAHRSIESGQPVYWRDMLHEFDLAAQGQQAAPA